MPTGEFHTGVAQPVAHVCSWLRRVYAGGAAPAPVLVTAPPAWLAEIDRALWVSPEREFLPHGIVAPAPPGAPATAAMSAAMAARTPLWLAPGWDATAPRAHALWINLGVDGVPSAPPAPRAIEVVADDESAAAQARARWRAYKLQGWTIEHRPGGRGAAAAP